MHNRHDEWRTIKRLGFVSMVLMVVISMGEMAMRIEDLEEQRDIYKSRAENWSQRAIDDEETIDALQQQVNELNETVRSIKIEKLNEKAVEAVNLSAKKTVTENKEKENDEDRSDWTYIGEFFCTAYCCEKYKHICGEGKGITASGAPVTAGTTVAADTSMFEYGTVLYIEGVGYRIVQDKGSAIKGKHLDVAVDTHANALKWSGYGNHKVWIVSTPENGG